MKVPWSAKIILMDSEGYVKVFTEKNIKRLELIE